MTLADYFYLLPYVGSVLITVSVSVYAFRIKGVRCAQPLAWFSLAMSLSTVGFIIETIVPSQDAKIFWDDMQWLPNSAVIIFALFITKEYTGERWKRPKLAYAAVVIPTLIISILAFTNPWHGLMHKDARIVESWPFKELTYTFTTPVYLFVAYIHAMFMYAIARMVLVLRTPMGHHRTQILLMTLALATPLLFSAITILELFPFIHRDLSPFSFALSASLMALGIFRYKLLDVLPLARSLIINSMTEGFVVIDHSCHIVDHNKAAIPLFIGEQSSFIGEDAHQVLPAWNDGKEHGLDCKGEAKTVKLVYSADGVDFGISVVPIFDSKDVQHAWLLTAHDLSSQKKIERSLRSKGEELENEVTEQSTKLKSLTRRLHNEEDELGEVLQALQDSEEVYRTIFDLSTVGIALRTMDGTPTSVNREMLRVLGLTREEYMNSSLDNLAHEANKDDLAQFKKILQEDGEAHLETQSQRKDGTFINIEVGSRVVNINDKPHVATTVRDVTARVEATRKLKSREIQLTKAQKVAKLAYWTLDAATGELDCSKELFEMLGLEPHNANMESMANAIHPDSRQKDLDEVSTAIEANKPFDVIHRCLLPDNSIKYVHTVGEPAETKADGAIVYFGISQDITEEVATKNALQQLLSTTNATGHEFFEALVLGLASAFEVKYAFVGMLSEDNKSVRTVAVCADGKIVDGMEYELEGSPCSNVIDKEVCFHRQDIIKFFPDDELLVEMSAESYLGIPLWCDTGEPLGVLALLGTSPMDRNAFPEEMLAILSSRAAIELERQQTQTELIENQHLLLNAERVGHTGGWNWDILTNEIVWSAGMYILHGTTSEEFELTLESAFSRIHPDDAERLQEIMARGVAEGGESEYEYRIIRLDDQIVCLKSRVSYVKDATGKTTSASGVVWDITQEHKAKLQREDLLTQVTQLKDELEQERDYLRHELKVNTEFGAIVGDSEPTRKVLSKIEAVAGTDASVLIHGQSGVGKELVASAIHEKSKRREGAFIKVNCASIPAELFESEFFGHVKGAFSGAVRDRIGRFQAADGGTLFLDEVGEIPLNLQSKLLRVLQEGEFERVGEDVSRKVNVRVIAATNRDLELESREGRFRNDLYFRLSVFPLSVPTLAERRDDIVPLAMHFIDKCTRRIGREPYELSRKQADFLRVQPWPGNIRELQHVIERAVILSQGDRLSLELAFTDTIKTVRDISATEKEAEQDYLTDTELKEFERNNLIAVLEATNWVISGKEGASARIGIKPSTLTSRMKSMNINKPDKSISN